ncbi:hypothetical protein SAMN05216389_104163 [Oceanobacillus limi]|uniref:Uncharacterized protein n=1 Tax=Oceanobacillus limi TaxID=930131 RepID=A0A1I0B3A6_9BACI|nr:hypothetical protein [Oceanobacillus limi]SET01236.1 hypothetical protein SAMN05216389_104163 [Oceanobacillus limi]
MRKGIYRFIIIVILLAGIIIYLGINNTLSSLSIPSTGLNKLTKPTFENQEIIEIKDYDDGTT